MHAAHWRFTVRRPEMNAMFCYIARARFTVLETDRHCAYIIIRCTAPYNAARETTTSVGLAHACPIMSLSPINDTMYIQITTGLCKKH